MDEISSRMESVGPGPHLSDAGSLPVGPCPNCEREVLGVRISAGDEGFACGFCDQPLRGIRWVAEEELGDLGFDAHDPLASGCATGCASGGCGPRR